MEYLDLEAQHLDGVLRLCTAEGWPSFPADPARALRVMTAPGVRTVVAVADGEVVGFARALTDGEITIYLAEIAVDSARRGRQVGRGLIETMFRRCGAERMDLLSDEEAETFYQNLPHWHVRKPGYRLYPPPPGST